MHNPTNINAVCSEKRLEAVVKRQKVEHEHLMAGHHKEMQSLRDSLHLARERFEAISNKNEEDLKNSMHTIDHTLQGLHERMKTMENTIAGQGRTIRDLYSEIVEFRNMYCEKEALKNSEKIIYCKIDDSNKNNIICFQEWQAQLKLLFQQLKDEFTNATCEMELRFADLTERVSDYFHIVRIDKEGLSKEIKAYDKTLFVIEKKLENIYTLINRLNKIGELCPKQE